MGDCSDGLAGSPLKGENPIFSKPNFFTIYSNNLSDHVWVKETEELIRHEQQSNSDNVEFSESFVELLKRDAEAEIIVEVWWEIEKVATDLYIRTLAGELPVDDARETLGKKMYSIISLRIICLP